MTKIPSDDILEGLYKLRIREFEKLKTVLELYNMEIHQKKAGPDYQRLKTIVKRSIEQNLRMKNFEARNGNFETRAVRGTGRQLQFPSRKSAQPNPSSSSSKCEKCIGNKESWESGSAALQGLPQGTCKSAVALSGTNPMCKIHKSRCTSR